MRPLHTAADNGRFAREAPDLRVFQRIAVLGIEPEHAQEPRKAAEVGIRHEPQGVRPLFGGKGL